MPPSSAAAVILAALASCAGAGDGDARFAGTAAPAAGCGETLRSSLTLKSGEFAFAPSDGVLVLRGHVAADGTMDSRVTTARENHAALVVTLHARREGDAVSGTYATSRCTYAVRLVRA